HNCCNGRLSCRRLRGKCAWSAAGAGLVPWSASCSPARACHPRSVGTALIGSDGTPRGATFLMAAFGHERLHALEIAAAPSIVDAATLAAHDERGRDARRRIE